MTDTVIYSGEFTQLPEIWEFHILQDSGKKRLHLTPKATLYFRAAEYGVDPTDVDTLLDIILHQHYVQRDAEDPKLQVAAIPHLLEADSTTQARNILMTRIRAASVQLEIRGNSALDPVRQGHKPDLPFIKRVGQEVDLARWMTRYGDLPTPSKPISKQVKGIPFVQTGIPSDPSILQTDSISSTVLTLG